MTMHADPSSPPLFITIAAAAARTGVCPKTIRRAIARGDLRAVRLGSRIIRIRVDELEQLGRPIPSARTVA
jgi:excisionase family DNA binding protein